MEAIKSTDYKELEETYFKLLTDATDLLDEVKKHTLQARKAMDQEPVNANALANEIVELAILNQRLGDRVAEAGTVARGSENHYKTVREEHKLELVNKKKMAAGVADSAKMKLAQNEFDLWNAALGLYEQLQYMRKSSDKTIDAIRSKLSFEKIDYKNA
jgi:hypothetical protein